MKLPPPGDRLASLGRTSSLLPMPSNPRSPRSARFHKRFTRGLQGIIVVGLAAEVYEAQWQNVAITFGILLLTVLPSLFARKMEIHIPAEFELLTIAFIFASVFLGETRDYYERFWWWDIALHTTSGGLLGIFGFLLVYVMNANPRIGMNLRPGFVAFFAFCFSLSMGALWGIFEFAMDQLFGFNMQKPMLGDPSGLTDTMWDLIVDALGALAISVMGYCYMRRGMESVIERWIQKFIVGNPRLFTQDPPHEVSERDTETPPAADSRPPDEKS
jgi:uncharacterized membrane protein YjdF